MDDSEQIKKLLQKNLEISRESFKILKKMHRAQKLGRAFKILYWLVIIAGIFGAYYYLQPVLSRFMEMWQNISADFSAIKETGKSLSPENLSPGLLDKVQDVFKP